MSKGCLLFTRFEILFTSSSILTSSKAAVHKFLRSCFNRLLLRFNHPKSDWLWSELSTVTTTVRSRFEDAFVGITVQMFLSDGNKVVFQFSFFSLSSTFQSILDKAFSPNNFSLLPRFTPNSILVYVFFLFQSDFYGVLSVTKSQVLCLTVF